MKIIIDIGNTNVKTAIFEGNEILEIKTSEDISIKDIEFLHKKYPEITTVIASSVRQMPQLISEFLKNNFAFIEFNENTPIPIKNSYKTPKTLGKDRLAGIIGAHYLFPGRNILVIDAGTCLTNDFLNSDGEYKGGSISPGINMRFKALHTFTGKLPLIALENYKELAGVDTKTSILAGVINGIVAETDWFIDSYKINYPNFSTIICGGDGKFLADRLKNATFAVPELVLIGLNEISKYNEY